MKTYIASLASGLIFGLGLTISQMVNPAKVIGFLDLFGHWDPSLAFVMGAALLVSFIGYRFVLRRKLPVLGERFHLPTRKDIDAKLLIGASLFGIGWGLIGLCPGPAIAGLLIAGAPAFIFIAAMLAGMIGYRVIIRS